MEICQFCRREFKTRSGLIAHEKYYCKDNQNLLESPRTRGSKIKTQEHFSELLELPWEYFILKVGHAEDILTKKRLFLEQEGRCSVCNLYEWNEKEIPLELDHIDGNHHDNSRNNVELLCPNCHAQTPTWRGRNLKNKAKKTFVSDEELIAALRREPSIRKALISCGLAGKGANYAKCYKLINENGIQALR